MCLSVCARIEKKKEEKKRNEAQNESKNTLKSISIICDFVCFGRACAEKSKHHITSEWIASDWSSDWVWAHFLFSSKSKPKSIPKSTAKFLVWFCTLPLQTNTRRPRLATFWACVCVCDRHCQTLYIILCYEEKRFIQGHINRAGCNGNKIEFLKLFFTSSFQIGLFPPKLCLFVSVLHVSFVGEFVF